ncbi:MAG TPA: hypothetical protein VGJ28_03885, partial [Micromonosporaceae bacterium]
MSDRSSTPQGTPWAPPRINGFRHATSDALDGVESVDDGVDELDPSAYQTGTWHTSASFTDRGRSGTWGAPPTPSDDRSGHGATGAAPRAWVDIRDGYATRHDLPAIERDSAAPIPGLGVDGHGNSAAGRPSSGYGSGQGSTGYNGGGLEPTAFDRGGVDPNGPERAGHERAGYDPTGHERAGYDGYDRTGHDRGGSGSTNRGAAGSGAAGGGAAGGGEAGGGAIAGAAAGGGALGGGAASGSAMAGGTIGGGVAGGGAAGYDLTGSAGYGSADSGSAHPAGYGSSYSPPRANGDSAGGYGPSTLSPGGHVNGYSTNGNGVTGHAQNGNGASGHSPNGNDANGRATTGYAPNGHVANGNGHIAIPLGGAANGHGAGGSGTADSGMSGYGANGQGANGHGANGQSTNGHGTASHGSSGSLVPLDTAYAMDPLAPRIHGGWDSPRRSTTADPAVQIDYELVTALQNEVSRQLIDALRGEVGLTNADRRRLTEEFAERVVLQNVESRLRAGETGPVNWPGYTEALRAAVSAYLIGLGRLQPLIDNPDVENIMVLGTRVRVVYANGAIDEDSFQSAASDEELIALLQRLAERGGQTERSLSTTKPILHLRLPDGARLTVIYVVTARPVVVIRRHRV